MQVCAAVLVAFLLLNKVSSPQYTLWLLPFLALLRVHWAWWAAFTVADALVYVGRLPLVRRADRRHRPVAAGARSCETGVWAKCLLLLVLFAGAAARRQRRLRLSRPSGRT